MQQIISEADQRRLSRNIMIAAGIASRGFAAQLGDRVNIYPVKGYSITVNLDTPESRGAAPSVSLLDDDAKIVTSRLGANRLRIAGTAEFTGENRDIRADRIGVWIDYTQSEGGLIATLTGRRGPLTNRAILWSLLRRPFGARRVLALIHWQALKLWWKGGGYRPRPEPPVKDVSGP